MQLAAIAVLSAICATSATTTPTAAAEPVTVYIGSQAKDRALISARLYRTGRPGRRPTIVALHGCGGLLTKSGRVSARHADWAARFVAAGYNVLLPDSFSERGYRDICRIGARQRPIRPHDRAGDAMAALAWLADRNDVDPARLALLGWSNGATSVLWAIGNNRVLAPAAPDSKIAFAFYPGCTGTARRTRWKPRMPLTILMGGADNWTPPGPCRELGSRPRVTYVEYAGAVHGFDHPNSRRRTRSGVGISATGTGSVEIGTDPVARAAAIDEVMRALAKAFAD